MMTPERMQQIEAIFHDACNLAPDERATFVAQACAGDEDLRREVELLLASDEQAATLIEAPAYQMAAPLLIENQPSSLAGQSISHYEIISLLGKGGMGEVYRARDTKLDRTVALKILPADVATDAERMRRFISEAKAASALNHPHVATIYEISDADNLSFFAMEYVEGQTLAAKINGHPLKTNEIVEIGSQIADALKEAHSQGITHRDIKPANIMLTMRGQVKVLDFGLAKIMRAAERPVTSNISTIPKTEPGVVMGTMPYMSPEQALGREVDHRTDIFSLGVVLYEMATGRLPFGGSGTGETLDRILHAQPEPIACFNHDAPAELERIVCKCLKKEPERRYPSAQELLTDLKNLQHESESAAVRAEQIVAPPKPSLNRLRLAAIALLLLTLIGLFIYQLFGRSQIINSVAVLPFANADMDTEHLSNGITESLINSLTKLPHLKVIARTTAFKYKGKLIDPQAVGRELGVDVLVTGTVVQQGDSLVVQADLVNAANGGQLWGERYNQKLSDVFAVQEEIARQISQRLRGKLTREEQQQVTKRYTQNFEAYQMYSMGRYFAEKRTDESLQKAAEYYQQALDSDPNYALPWVGLSDVYWLGIGSHLPPDDNRAKAAAEKALALDESLSEAHTSLGRVLLQQDWNWVEAEKELKRAIELNPNSAFAHRIYGHYLTAMSRDDQALSERKLAQQIDPLSIIINLEHAWTAYMSGATDQALTQDRKTLEMDPNFVEAYQALARLLALSGRYAEAIAELEKALPLSSRQEPTTRLALGYVYALWGKRDEALKKIEEAKELAKYRYVSQVELARVYTALRENEQAFEWLRKGCQVRDRYMIYLKAWPEFKSLRTDPQFAEVVRCVGLP